MEKLKFLNRCVGLALLAVTNIGYSSGFWNILPFAGMEAKYWYIEGRGDYDDAFHRNHFGGTGYLGVKQGRASVEVGYDVGFKRHKDFNATSIGGDNYITSARGATNERLRAYYIEGHYYWSTISPDIMMIFALGMSLVKPEVSLIVNNINRDVVSHNRYVIRVGYGGEYQIFSWLAARSLLRYENTELAKFSYSHESGQRDSGRWLKDNLSLTLGLMFTWPKCQ